VIHGFFSHQRQIVDPYAGETADEKRVRLARQYLDKLKELKESESSEEEDTIHNMLHSEVVCPSSPYHLLHRLDTN
jgi:hypothetical protein